MEKKKTFGRAALCGIAALTLLGVIALGGNERSFNVKGTSTHDITMTTSSSFRPKTLGKNEVTDTSLGLSSGGYLVIGLSGSGDGTNPAGSQWLIAATANSTSSAMDISATIDIYANNIASASFVGGSTGKAGVQTISLYANNADQTEEAALKSETATSSIDSTGLSTPANHIRYFVKDSHAANEDGITVYITSVSLSFNC